MSVCKNSGHFDVKIGSFVQSTVNVWLERIHFFVWITKQADSLENVSSRFPVGKRTTKWRPKQRWVRAKRIAFAAHAGLKFQCQLGGYINPRKLHTQWI